VSAREFDPACDECNRTHMNWMWARGDFADLRRKLRSPRAGADLYERMAVLKVELVQKEAAFEEHCARVHSDGFGEETESRVIQRLRRPVKKAALIPDGKAKCMACRKVVSVVGGTRLRRHKEPNGDQCPNVQLGEGHVLKGPAPEVKIPRLSARSAQGRERRDESEPSRLDAGSNCRECGKWLPGERILCGRCSVSQGRAS